MKKHFCILFAFLISTSAHAGKLDGESWLASFNVGMNNHSIDTGGGPGKHEATTTDLTVGYTRAKGFYLGGIYGSGSGGNSYSHMGLSIGFVKNGWVVMGHYLLGGTYTYTDTEYEKGSGNQIDVGYLFKTGSSMFLGFQITSRTMNYEAKVGTGELEVVDLYPALKIAYFW